MISKAPDKRLATDTDYRVNTSIEGASNLLRGQITEASQCPVLETLRVIQVLIQVLPRTSTGS